MTERGFFDVIVIGGGLAGLTAALHLSRSDVSVLVIEKHTYPNHKVCGEYVSNEVLPYLKQLGIDPMAHGARDIRRFEITQTNGERLTSKLPMGGFGISRYKLDNLFYEHARDRVTFQFDTVTRVAFHEGEFHIYTKKKAHFVSRFVVGAHGKRSGIDISLDREFIREKSPWLGVKAHYEADFPDDMVALHNFEGGYCGLSKTETGSVNACFLVAYDSFKRHGDLDAFQKSVLSSNPYLRRFFEQGRPVFDKPLTISQISFAKKAPVEQHILMAGDSAGLIHPLCGNGMAMAVHSAKLLSELMLEAFPPGM